MLISDFGSKTYLDVLNKETMYCLYKLNDNQLFADVIKTS